MCWCLSGKDCAKSAVAIERGLLIERKQDFVGSKASQHPMNEDRRPEVDVSSKLSPELAQQFQQLVGLMRRAVKLGRVDCETSRVQAVDECHDFCIGHECVQ